MDKEKKEEEKFKKGQKKKGKIGELEEKLYSRETLQEKERTELKQKRYFLPEDWESGEELYAKEREREHKSGLSFYTKLFFASLAFFAVAATVAVFALLGNKNVVSPQNVEISVFAPVSVSGGDVLSIQIAVENKNSLPLPFANLSAVFPEGTRAVDDPSKPFIHFHNSLGEIAPGEIRTETIKAIVFGNENSEFEVDISLDYGLEGSNATFTKEKTYIAKISAPPLAVTIKMLEEINVGQPISIDAEIVSVSTSLVENALVRIDYPKGFVYKNASPQPDAGNNIWRLKSLRSGEKVSIKIDGAMEGEEAQEKAFWIYTGSSSARGGTSLDTLFSSLLRTITIKKPFLGVTITINGKLSEQAIVKNGDRANVLIFWENNLPQKIIEGEIEASVRGSVVNRERISPAEGGFYRSTDDVILWDFRKTRDLQAIEAGKQSVVSFSFATLPSPLPDSNTIFKNSEIEIDVTVRGKRVAESGVPEEVRSFIKRTIRVGTDARFVSRNVHFTGPIQNTGPLPPQVETETTYTVVWSVINTSNDISDAKVSAVIPQGVRWTGNVFPNGSHVNYNPETHEIAWNVGRVPAGTGYENDAKEVAFQLALFPSLGQLGSIPEILGEARFVGRDVFTGAPLEESTRFLSTQLSTDPLAGASHAAIVATGEGG